METFVDMAYEDLMNQYLFEPLQMTHCGFGAMGVSKPSVAERCHYIWGTRDEALDPAGPGGVVIFAERWSTPHISIILQ